ncbi:hypothetical protein C6401_15150 [Arthrobacter woluwensis]|uniref:hypothetical protein n=1 Tax=Arthrobacter woluwensis TaxID=156980 RepID=UPI000D124D14|nr:hypothetical protein [Arthrobacter woluwensis]PSS42894.1 hypothetical protein C6401_15150 [Arthrobacter woluwensis]
MSTLSRDAAWFVGQMTQARAQTKALSQPQLGTSSIEQGTIEEYDGEDTLVSLTGTQFDGTHTLASVNGPVPPVPSQPSAVPGPKQVQVRWNGKWDDEDTVSPMDFSHVSVHMSREEVFDPDADTQVAQIRGESGDSVTVLREPGEWWLSLVAVSQSGKWSDPTDPVLVEIPDGVDLSEYQDAQVEIDDRITEVWETASGKNKIHNSTVDPTPTDTGVDGDRWQVWTTLSPGGKLTATWRHNGVEWIKEALDEVYLPLVNIGSGTYGELTGSRLTAGTVTAQALEAVMVLVNTLIAGDPNGTHARMTPQGFLVMASPDGGVTPPTVVVRMGVASTDDYFSVLRSDGTIAASISATGDVAGENIVGEAFSLSGKDLQTEIVDPLPKGIIVRAGRGTNAQYWAGTTPQPYLQLDFDAEGGRMYQVTTTAIALDSDTTTADGVVNLHYRTDGSPAEPTSTIIASGQSVMGTLSTRRSVVTLSRPITPDAGPVSLLLSYGTVSAGRSKIVASNGRSVFLTVEDMGIAPPDVGIIRDGTGDAATGGTGGGSNPGTPAPKNYDRTWNATGIRSFTGSGGRYDFNTGYMFSGLSPAGYGDLSSMAVFPDFTSILNGATVTGVWVYVFYDFWYYGSGGTAYIGLHGQTGLTNTAPSKTYAHATSAGWPRAAGRWIKMSSSTYAGFKSGQHRGITLGGAGGGYTSYGYAHGPKIRITYTK